MSNNLNIVRKDGEPAHLTRSTPWAFEVDTICDQVLSENGQPIPFYRGNFRLEEIEEIFGDPICQDCLEKQDDPDPELLPDVVIDWSDPNIEPAGPEVPEEEEEEEEVEDVSEES